MKNTQTETGMEAPSPVPLRFDPSPALGLSDEQVRQQREDGLVNLAVDPPTKSVWQIVRENLFTYFNLVFAILAALVIAAGSLRSLTFMVVVVVNALVGIVQELRAKAELDKLSVLNAPRARVIRAGREWDVAAEELVQEDVVVFRAGAQVCADAVVLTGNCAVNESLLTGEQDEVSKSEGDELMSGSFLVSGECRARLTRVGRESYVSQLAQRAKAMDKKEQSEMLRTLDRLVAVIGIIIIPIGALLFWQAYVQDGATFSESIVSMVAAIVGMIPEGLYFLTSIALAVSVVRLSRQNVLVHNMKCIETLSRVDVLCVDKTGTITEPEMRVTSFVPLPGYDPRSMPPLRTLLSDFAAAQSPDNATMEALRRAFVTTSGLKAESVVPFSSRWKYSAAVFEGKTYLLGAPELVLRENYELIRTVVETYSAEGSRVLVLALYSGVPDGEGLTGEALPLSLVLLSNPIRPDARETFRYFAEQGVRIKVISGDNPVTVSHIAAQAGISGAERYVDASTLGEAELPDAVEKYTVFGRVTPEQKRLFVQALKKAGHTVGMTGDGVNDILALKDADCSVAMASGSEAASQVSQLVLLDSNFAKMPAVVGEGRRVVNNIQRSAALFLVKNIFSLLMAVFSVCFGFRYPLEPSQVSLISSFSIGLPSFFLALQPERSRIEGHFMTNVLVKALPAGLTDFLVVGALVIFGQVFVVDPDEIATASTLLLAIVGFMILYRISQPMNTARWGILALSGLGLIISSVFFPWLFALEKMTTRCVMLLGVFALVTEPLLRYGIQAVDFTARGFRIWHKSWQENRERRALKKKIEQMIP